MVFDDVDDGVDDGIDVYAGVNNINARGQRHINRNLSTDYLETRTTWRVPLFHHLKILFCPNFAKKWPKFLKKPPFLLGGNSRNFFF